MNAPGAPESLVVLSTTAFWRDSHGQLFGHGPTVLEYGRFLELFDRVVVYGVLLETRPHVPLAPVCDQLDVRFVPFYGSPGLLSKVRFLPQIAQSIRLARMAIREAQAVHFRAPDNFAVLGLFFGGVSRHPFAWAKYAGCWGPWKGESLAYRLTRWLLRSNHLQMPVTVNPVGSLPRHCHAFKNPSFGLSFVEEGERRTVNKVLAPPVRLITIGALIPGKGMEFCLSLASELTKREIPNHLDIVGDGPLRDELEGRAGDMGISTTTTFHGVLNLEAFAPILVQAHFVVRTTVGTEGWPKVLSEGMSHRCVPLAFDRGAIGPLLRESDSGTVVDQRDVQGLADGVQRYLDSPGEWSEQADRAQAFSRGFTYEAYIIHLRKVLEESWGVVLKS